MKHLYEVNEPEEIYTADSEEDMIAHYRYLCNEDPDYIKQLPDQGVLPECPHCGRGGETHAEFAAQFSEPTQVFTAYN